VDDSKSQLVKVRLALGVASRERAVFEHQLKMARLENGMLRRALAIQLRGGRHGPGQQEDPEGKSPD
jgi:hypothetical protein